MDAHTGNYPVTYTVDTPDTLSRWLWLFKWLLLIPHIIVIGLLGIVSWFTLLASWVAILITGKRPAASGIFTWEFRDGQSE